MTVCIEKISSPEQLAICMAIRKQVFVIGQNVPIEQEKDNLDNASEHYLIFVDNVACGTTRVRHLEQFTKIERVAVLDEYQGRGLGKQLMAYILADLQNNTVTQTVKLSSQVHALAFYERLGFTVCSEEYLDAGIMHKDMKLELKRVL